MKFEHLSIPCVLFAVALPVGAQTPAYSFDRAQTFLKTYCQGCHTGKTAVGGFRLERVAAPASLSGESHKWQRAMARVRDSEMPPKGASAPDMSQREQFTEWVDRSLRAEACSTGVAPGPAIIRRLNRDEYTATIRDLLDIHMDIAASLPADGAGGEGFDNAAETLFLSPLHAEKYMEVAKFVVDFAAKEYKSKAKIFTAEPGPKLSEDAAAREIFRNFLPRAFRRPVSEEELAPYLGLYKAGRKQGMPFDSAILLGVRGALISPMFLFRIERPYTGTEPKLLDDFALASRISYFLWGSMPDELLFDVAASGKLQDPEVLRQLTRRMLRNDRSLNFTQRFVEQWLRTRELGVDKKPDPELFPTYATDEELRGDIRFQPILFFRELLLRDMPLMNLIESRYTIGTSNLAKHYDVTLPLNPNARKQPQWVELPPDSRRGGLLGMAAVLAVSSYPYRTSPVLRGAWVLDSLLGTPPLPPPPNVPQLEENAKGAPPKSVRERLEQHRANPACAGCHSKMDPVGFALENYDAIGRWRTEDAGKPIDASGELADGAHFRGPEDLKALILERKTLFVRNLATKMLGYALGRGLTLKDSCAVDAIVADVQNRDYSAQALVEAIVLSVPFRYQAGRPAPPAAHASEGGR